MCTLRRLFIVASLALLGGIAPSAVPAQAKDQPLTAPTYTVFATREGLVGHRTANGHRIVPRDRFVALPSWQVLSSRGGNEFQVRVSYRGRSVVLPVWDVGPWNTHDNYWSTQRRYGNLPVGVPMAQAAYNDGYNRGRDEFGRRIRMPNGIDIADGAFWDDLGMTKADWVEVTFLWMGNDPGAQAGVPEQQPVVSDERISIEPNAIMVDDGAVGYNGEAAVIWYDQNCGLNGRSVWTYGTRDAKLSENRARWTPALPGPGLYEALVYIPACGRQTTTAARYRITYDGAVSEIVVDQRRARGSWVSLGIYHMGGGAPAAVELSDVTGDDGQAVVFDAITWVPRIDTTPPTARATDAQLRSDGSLLVRWNGSDDLIGIAAFDVQVQRLPDGGWTDWQTGVTTLEAAFVPPGPGSYAFRARANDWVGNRQPWHDGADVMATVGGG